MPEFTQQNRILLSTFTFFFSFSFSLAISSISQFRLFFCFFLPQWSSRDVVNAPTRRCDEMGMGTEYTVHAFACICAVLCLYLNMRGCTQYARSVLSPPLILILDGAQVDAHVHIHRSWHVWSSRWSWLLWVITEYLNGAYLQQTVQSGIYCSCADAMGLIGSRHMMNKSQAMRNNRSTM